MSTIFYVPFLPYFAVCFDEAFLTFPMEEYRYSLQRVATAEGQVPTRGSQERWYRTHSSFLTLTVGCADDIFLLCLLGVEHLRPVLTRSLSLPAGSLLVSIFCR